MSLRPFCFHHIGTFVELSQYYDRSIPKEEKLFILVCVVCTFVRHWNPCLFVCHI